MYAPNTNQISFLSRKRLRPNYIPYIQAEVDALPAQIALDEERAQNERVYNLERDALDQERRIADKSLKLQKRASDIARSQKEYANMISALGLGIEGVSTINELTGGGITKAVKSVPRLFDFGPDMPVLPRGVNLAGIDVAGAPAAMSSLARGADEFITQPIASGAKKLASGLSDSWSDISDWAGSLFDFGV